MAHTDLAIFCRTVRKRSNENGEALLLLFNNHLIGNVMSILRQELDSMVRCIFLLSITDRQYRDRLLHDSVNGKKWRKSDGRGVVTDKEMVDLANNLQGWTRSVYKFGCGFIHLSSFHDYSDRDPLDSLTPEMRLDIAHHLQHYHFVRLDQSTKFQDIEHVLPAVFSKIAANLEWYVERVEASADLES